MNSYIYIVRYPGQLRFEWDDPNPFSYICKPSNVTVDEDAGWYLDDPANGVAWITLGQMDDLNSVVEKALDIIHKRVSARRIKAALVTLIMQPPESE